jgi:hypothetical protein
MKFNCTIEMENDAFKGIEPLTHPILEVARILKELSKDLDDAFVDGDTNFDGYLRDRNGNKVGQYAVEGVDDV